MSQKNEDAVRRLIEAVNAGEWDTALALISEDVVLTLAGDARLAGEGAVGKEAYVRWFADWFRTFERGYRFSIDELRAEGDTVHAKLTHHARGRASGAEVTMPSTWVYELRDGRVVRADGTSG